MAGQKIVLKNIFDLILILHPICYSSTLPQLLVFFPIFHPSKHENYSFWLNLVNVALQSNEECLHELMFGDYMNLEKEIEDRVYEEVTSIDAFYAVVEQSLEEYNNINKSRMNLVIFRWKIKLN